MSLHDVVVIFFTALTCSAVGLFFLTGRQTPLPSAQPSPESEISLLFRSGRLQHASAAGMRLAPFQNSEDDWNTLRKSLLSRFPNFPIHPPSSPNTLVIKAACESDIAKVAIRKMDDSTHVELIDQETLPLDVQQKIKALEAEVQTNEFAGATAPNPIWFLDHSGQITWKNARYMALHEQVCDSPDDTLFDISQQMENPLSSTRISVTLSTGEQLWYDISTVKLEAGTMCHATDINAVINAEIAQRNFVQTLAKTFAQLSTGLAIFDRNGQLALFNPALVDLSTLPAEFLSSRPDLLSFFDRLRDSRVMPEPKNYHSWRQEIADVIAAATDGKYQETWTLDTGQTYRVAGRPHPDGAIAFLIEDISAEISLARSFRSELAMGQSIMDSFDTGMVVFSATGILQFCNSAYRDIWSLDPENPFDDVSVMDSIKDWTHHSDTNPEWNRLRDFVMRIGDRTPWESTITQRDGTRLTCTVRPIALGATLILFKPDLLGVNTAVEKPLELLQ